MNGISLFVLIDACLGALVVGGVVAGLIAYQAGQHPVAYHPHVALVPFVGTIRQTVKVFRIVRNLVDIG